MAAGRGDTSPGSNSFASSRSSAESDASARPTASSRSSQISLNLASRCSEWVRAAWLGIKRLVDQRKACPWGSAWTKATPSLVHPSGRAFGRTLAHKAELSDQTDQSLLVEVVRKRDPHRRRKGPRTPSCRHLQQK
eukprot:CAMPEP_0181189050 /NCGR_PEP_ID=MMETSP1096-20121128/11454_1 /TAXON_ID=156174 ORGANISM="Chrysochromulina ericina, Strain CCMP281" /NCGR_SAMPLE_ID=MMETSP1096 /ASSEMBLY_ACC=CAM_ASM_000453 /LENGTH=135 /DNA_ID=CAMNT_0023278175 /DNA_START=126 /DNA_END=533 /DNA_ORIENTATION=-